MPIKKYVCPMCRKTEGVDIVYGLPSPELMELVAQGLVALGGCVVDDREPDRRCMACDHEWKIKRRNSSAERKA